MGRKMKTVPRPTPAPDIGSALASMGTAFMPDMGQAKTAPPKVPPPILPPGQGPMKRPSSKPSKRFIKTLQKPMQASKASVGGKSSSVGGKRASVASNGMRKKASDAIANSGPKMKGKPDKMSETVDKEQRKQINDILPKEKKQRA